MVDALNDTTAYSRDPNGNVLTITRANNAITTNTYDTMNRLIASTDPLGGLNSWTFDHAGNCLSFTDANSHTYNWSYNYLNQKTSATYPDNSTEQWVYAASENLSQYTNAAAKVELFTFDSRNRVTSWTWNTGDQYADTADYQYDAAGNLLQVANSYSTVTNTYNAANELLSQTQAPVGGAAETINYQYNADRFRSSLVIPGVYALQWGYDSCDRVSGIFDGSGNSIAAYTYDVAGNRLGRVLANSILTSYAYDQLNRLGVQSEGYGLTFGPGNPWVDSTYTYDSVGRITNVAYGATGSDGNRTYGYDLKDQLNSIQIADGQPPGLTSLLTYDLAGNRTSTQLDSSVATNYSSNSLNQYTAVGTVTPQYDQQHNLTSYNGSIFTYDWSRHLFSATNGPSDVESRYDGLGRCVTRTVNGTVTYITYDGWRPILETSSAGIQTAARIYGVGVDELIEGFASASSTGYYYKQDNVGNVTALTASSGAAIELYNYDPFGHVTIYNGSGALISTSAYGNRFMFQGHEYIAAVNLYDFRARAYSPDIGRFLQMDPIGFAGGNSLYRFVNNNPVTGTDPLGMDTAGIQGMKVTYNPAGLNNVAPIEIQQFGDAIMDYEAFAVITTATLISVDPEVGAAAYEALTTANTSLTALSVVPLTMIANSSEAEIDQAIEMYEEVVTQTYPEISHEALLQAKENFDQAWEQEEQKQEAANKSAAQANSSSAANYSATRLALLLAQMQRFRLTPIGYPDQGVQNYVNSFVQYQAQLQANLPDGEVSVGQPTLTNGGTPPSYSPPDIGGGQIQNDNPNL